MTEDTYPDYVWTPGFTAEVREALGIPEDEPGEILYGYAPGGVAYFGMTGAEPDPASDMIIYMDDHIEFEDPE